MYLLIDLSSLNRVHLVLFDEMKIVEFQEEGKNREALSCIDRFLSEQKCLRTDVRGIMVVVGTGGFTSTRIGTTVANGFAYALQIPVLAITADQVGMVQELIPELLSQPVEQYVSAAYSGEPNIGKKVC